MRILLDTNVWLAILTTDGHCRRWWRAAQGRLQIYVSAQILDEIEEKLRVKFGFSARHARLLTHFVRQKTVPVEITGALPNVCRDAADNGILAAALAAHCDKLVTGDNDLLMLKEFNGIAILTPGEFSKLVSGN